MNTIIEKRKKVVELLAELQQLQREINREETVCPHEWGEVQYDPEHYREPSGYRFVGQGSDFWNEPTGYQDATRPRWSRTCLRCGKKEFTKKEKPANMVPDFGK